MASIKITSKRQVTFPVALCKDMGLEPGDRLDLESRFVEGEQVWVIRPQADKFSWIGALKGYGKNRPHDMKKIRRSIARGQRK